MQDEGCAEGATGDNDHTIEPDQRNESGRIFNSDLRDSKRKAGFSERKERKIRIRTDD